MPLIYSSNRLLDGLQASASLAIASTGSVAPQFFFGPTTSFSFTKKYEYYLSFNAYCEKVVSTFDARVDVYLSGSAFPSPTDSFGKNIGSIVCANGVLTKNFGLQEYEFLALNTGTAILKFVVYSGLWSISNVIFQIASWPGYNPDQAYIQVPIDGVAYRYRKIKIRAELYDINNNFIPSNNFIVESPELLITGSNAAFQGADNRLAGTLMVGLSGSGAMLGADMFGSYIGLQGGITSASLPRPVNPFDLNTYIGPPIITMYSGSQPFLRTTTSGSALGIQITDGTATGSYLNYDTTTKTLTIRGDITLLPGTSLSQSISSGSGASGVTALAEIQALVSGTLIGGTYLTGTSIISPIIAGNTGYFSTQFGVGNISGNNGIILTSLGYTGSTGTPVSGAPAIYIGQGTVGNVNTPFIVASGSTGPVFALGNQFTFDSAGAFIKIFSSSVVSNNITVLGTLQSLNSNLQTLNATTINATGSITTPMLTVVDEFVTDGINWTNLSGSAVVGTYSITKTTTGTGTFPTASAPFPQAVLTGASASLVYSGNSHGETDATQSWFINTNGSASYNSQYTLTIPWNTFKSTVNYVNWSSFPYAQVNIYYNTNIAGDGTLANLISNNNVALNSNGTITNTVTINTGSFNIVVSVIAATDVSQDNPGANTGTTTVKTNSKLSNIAWIYQTGSSANSSFNRYGLLLNASISGGDPHIHLNAINSMSIQTLTAGDFWFETSGSANTQASGSFRVFDGKNIIALQGVIIA